MYCLCSETALSTCLALAGASSSAPDWGWFCDSWSRWLGGGLVRWPTNRQVIRLVQAHSLAGGGSAAGLGQYRFDTMCSARHSAPHSQYCARETNCRQPAAASERAPRHASKQAELASVTRKLGTKGNGTVKTL